MADIVDRLLDAADRLEELRRDEIQILLRQAVVDIRTLRTLVGIRDEVWLETTKPAGRG